MLITLVRHGECLAQADPEHLSDVDSRLTKLGRSQAVAAAGRLSTQSVTHILSSPLTRALETAETIAQFCGIREVAVWLSLREGFGSTRQVGLSRQRMQEQFVRTVVPAEVTANGWPHGDPDLRAFWDRCTEVVARLRAEYAPDDHLAIVTHGGCANYLLHVLLGMDRGAPRWFELSNGSLTRIRLVPNPRSERPNWPLYPPVPVEVHSLNDVSHLADAGRAE